MGVGGVAVRLLYVGFHGRKVQNQLSRKIALYGSKTDGGRSIPASIVRRLSRSLVTLLSLTQRETNPQRWDRFESTLHYCGPWSLHFPASAQPAKPLVPLRGLTAQECFFPVMAVREGLVKTAIKTTETGCIQRRRWRMSWSATTALSGIFWAISSTLTDEQFSYNYPVDVTDKKSGFMSGMLQVGLDDSPLELQAKLDEEYAQSTPDTHFHLQSQSRLRSSCEPSEDSQKHKQTWEADGATVAKPNGIYERIPNRWEVGLAVAVLDGQFQHVSFANSISTTKGRAPTCCGQNLEEHSPTFGRAIVKAAQIRNHLYAVFAFGTKPLLSEDLMKKVSKSPIVDNILNWAQFKADQQIKKTDGTKRSRETRPDHEERGDAEHQEDYGSSARERLHEHCQLAVWRLMIMADQDHDGSHIKGLIINFLDHFYPSLLKLDDFLVEFVTPIVRVTKGARQRKDFFTIPEYEQWVEETPDSAKWDVKYYKGLGTSKDSDARDYFSHMEKHMIPFARTQDGDRELIELAFSKKKADERKEWLRQFKVRPGTYLDHRLEEIPYSEFINKELILFSMADNIRSIPCVADGLKPGQRKVMWDCFKRIMKKEVKVAQLIGYIVNMPHTTTANNNINLLEPNGQYGARDQGGKDHASARYIHTLLTRISRAIYHPHDDPLLNQQKDDNGR
ncbi:topoisomerase II [Mycena polygramma]|nr:topoisomerase II [Mycena polygramma]